MEKADKPKKDKKSKKSKKPVDSDGVEEDEPKIVESQWGAKPVKEESKKTKREAKIEAWKQQMKVKIASKNTHPRQKQTLSQMMTLTKKHAFWDTQPVRKFMEDYPEKDGPLEKS